MLSADTTTTGINGWLEYERGFNAIDADVYKFLNDYNEIAAQLLFPPDDSHNLNAQKSFAHTQRFMPNNPFWAWFESDPSNDEASAKMLFAAMMRLSGSRRRLSFVSATRAEDFVEQRRNITALPSEQITESLTKIDTAQAANINGLRKLADISITQGISVEDILYDYRRGAVSRDDALKATQELDTSITDITVGLIVFSADIRDGNIESVPILEPRSITKNPQVIYPFTAGFWQSYTPTL